MSALSELPEPDVPDCPVLLVPLPDVLPLELPDVLPLVPEAPL